MAEYSLFDAPAEDPKDKPAPARGRVSWRDYGRAIGGGLASQTGGILRSVETENSPEFLKNLRRGAESTGENLQRSLSPEAQARMQRRVLTTGDDSIFQNWGEAIPLQLAGSVLPSLAITGAAALGGAKVAGAAGLAGAGARVGMAAAGYGMGAGEVERQIADTISSAPEKSLGPLYTELRKSKSEQDARDELARRVASGYSQGAGALSAVLNQLGPVASIIRGAVSGKGASAFADASIKRAVGKQAAIDAADETIIEGAGQEAMYRGYGLPRQPGELAEAAAKGALFGGIVGGGARVVSGPPQRDVTDTGAGDAAQNEALNSRATERATDGQVAERIVSTATQRAEQARQAIDPVQSPMQMGPFPETAGGEQYGPPAPRFRSAQAVGSPTQMGPFPETAGGDVYGPTSANRPDPVRVHQQMGPFPETAGGAMYGPVRGGGPVQGPMGNPVYRGLRMFADENNGVIDPMRISAYMRQSGRNVSPEQVIESVQELVQAGVLRQRMMPGTRGYPTFTMPAEQRAQEPGWFAISRVGDEQGPAAPPAAIRPPARPLMTRAGETQGPPSPFPARSPQDPNPGPLFEQGELFADQRPGPGTPPMRPQGELPLVGGANDRAVRSRDPSAQHPSWTAGERESGAARRSDYAPGQRELPLAGGSNRRPAPQRAERPAPARQAAEPVRAPGPTRRPRKAKIRRAEIRKPEIRKPDIRRPNETVGEKKADAPTTTRKGTNQAPRAAALKAKAEERRPKRAGMAATAPAVEERAPTKPVPQPAEKTAVTQEQNKPAVQPQDKPAERAPKAAALKEKAKSKVEPKAEPKAEPETGATGTVPAREALSDRTPRDVKAPSKTAVRKVASTLKGKSAAELRAMAVDAAPKDRQGNPDVGVIDGVIRTVYYDGVPRPKPVSVPALGRLQLSTNRRSVVTGAGGLIQRMRGQEVAGPFPVPNPAYRGPTTTYQEVTLADWESDLSPSDRQKVVAILQAWRAKHGKALDAKGKRPLVTWLTRDEAVEARAKKELASNEQIKALAARVNRGAAEPEADTTPKEVSDANLVREIKRQFKKAERGLPNEDADVMVASIMADAKKEMQRNGFAELDYPKLLDLSKQRLTALEKDTSPTTRMNAVLGLQEAARAVVRGDTVEDALDQNVGERIARAKQGPREPILAGPGTGLTQEGQRMRDALTRTEDAADDAARIAAAAERIEQTYANRARREGYFDSLEGREGGTNRRTKKMGVDGIPTRTRDGDDRRFDKIRDEGLKLAATYENAKMTPPAYARAVQDYEHFRTINEITKKPHARHAPQLAILRDRVLRESRIWDDDRIGRRKELQKEFFRRTPKGVFDAHPPATERGELANDALVRLVRMAEDFMALQKTFRNVSGKQNDITKGSDPFTHFMRRAMRILRQDDGVRLLAVDARGNERPIDSMAAMLDGETPRVEIARTLNPSEARLADGRVKEVIAEEMLLRAGYIKDYILQYRGDRVADDADMLNLAQEQATGESTNSDLSDEAVQFRSGDPTAGKASPLVEGETYTPDELLSVLFGENHTGSIQEHFGEFTDALVQALENSGAKITVMSEGAIAEQGRQAGVSGARAVYDPRTGNLWLPAGASTHDARISALHELTHAATQDGLRSGGTKELADALWAEIGPQLSDGRLSNVSELVAYGFTEANAFPELSKIRLSDGLARRFGLQGGKTGLSGFLDLVLRAIGWRKNPAMIEAVLALGRRAIAETGPRGGQAEAQQVLFRSLNSGGTTGLGQSLRDASANAGLSARRKLIPWLTNTDISAIYGSLYDWTGDGVRQYLRDAFVKGPMDQWEKSIARRAARTRQIVRAYEADINRLADFRRMYPELALTTGQLANEMTLHRIDATRDTAPNTARGTSAEAQADKARYDALRARYLALPEIARDKIVLARDIAQKIEQDKSYAAVRSILLTRWQQAQEQRSTEGLPENIERDVDAITRRFLDGEATDADLAWVGDGAIIIDTYRAALRRSGFYVPLQRHGDHIVFGERTDYEDGEIFDTMDQALARRKEIEDAGGLVTNIYKRSEDGKFVMRAQTRVMFAADTAGEAQRIARDLQAEGIANVKTEMREGSFQFLSKELDPKQNEQITKAIKSLTSDEAMQKQLLDAYREAAIRLLPRASIKHHSLTRKNTLGASQDLARTMSGYVSISSQYQAALEHRPFERAAEMAMRDFRLAKRADPDDESNDLRQMVENELQARKRLDDEHEGRGGFMQAVSRVSALYFLASPSYTMINLTQPWLVGAPVLGRLFPKAAQREIVSAMRDAHNDVGGLRSVAGSGTRALRRAVLKWRRRDTGKPLDMIGTIKQNLQGSPDAAEISRFLDQLVLDGRIEEHAGIEVARVRQGEGNAASRAFRFAEELTRAFPAAGEVLNRSVMAVAAYRLSKKHGKGRSPLELYDAMDMAIRESQFVYNPENTARVFRENKLAMPFFVFKKFVQGMYTQLIKNAYNSVRGESKEVRQAARRQLTMTLAAHGLAAGAIGLPTEPIKIALAITALAFGEDEPYDVDAWITRQLNEVFGDVSPTLTKGLPTLIGLDVSSRLSLGNLALGQLMADNKEDSTFEWLGKLALGAPGSIGAGVLRGMNTLREGGEPSRAFEQMAPKAIRDAMVAQRLAEEGMTDREGNRIDEGEIGDLDVFYRAIGFRGRNETAISEARRFLQKDQRSTARERGRLHRAIQKAQKEGDADGIARVQEQITEFNVRNPQAEITEQSIRRSTSQKERARGRSVYGVPLRVGSPMPDLSRFGLNPQGRGAGDAAPAVQPDVPAAGAQEVSYDLEREPFYKAIIVAEGTARDGDPYNEVLGYGAYGRPDRPLTEMTLQEIYDFGQQVIRPRHRADMARKGRRTPGSSAMGAFQIVGSTMREFMGEAGLSWDDKFTPDNQRRLAAVIARRQGLPAWEGFKHHPRQRLIAQRAFKIRDEAA